MVADRRYLIQRRGKNRSGDRYYVRMRVPADLRGRFGKAHFVEQALHTGDLKEAQRRRHAVVAGILAQFAEARQTRTLPEIVAAARQAEMRRAWPIWRATFLERGRAEARERLGHLLDVEYIQIGDQEHEPDPGEDWRRRGRRVLLRFGAEQTAQAVEQIAVALLEAHVDAADIALDGRELPGTARTPRPNGLTVTKAAERYLAERMRDPNARWRQQTADAVNATVRLFADHVGDAPLSAITRQDGSTFLDQLARLHRDFARRPGSAKLTFGELLQQHAGEPSLSNRTLNRRSGELHGLFRWAKRRTLYDGDNPFAEQHRTERSRGWLPFTIDELGALFTGPLFPLEIDIKEKHRTRAALPWIMLVALYSGLRLGEVCSLDLADVRQEEGVWLFDITEAKSEAGVRKVPVHSQLVAAGFLKRLAAVKAAGHEQLWPGLAPGGADAKLGHYVSKRFTEYRRKCGVNRERVSFHSFRKNVVEALERARVHQSEVAQIVGHERGFTFGTYSPLGLDLAGRRRVVEQIAYHGMEFPA